MRGLEWIQVWHLPRSLTVGLAAFAFFLVSALSGVGSGSAAAATVNVCPTTGHELADAITAAGSGGTVMFNCATDTTVRFGPDPVTPDPVNEPENTGSTPSSVDLAYEFAGYQALVPTNFTATVTPNSPQPTGTVTVTQNGSPLPGCENVPLDGTGHASCTGTVTKVGLIYIGAVYHGDSNYAPSDMGGGNDFYVVSPTGPGYAITIGNDVTLDASQAGGKVTLDGSDLTRMFTVQAGGHLTVKGLTLANGNAAPGPGGAIFNHGGHLTVADSTFTDNEAQYNGTVEGPPYGGAIASDASGVADLTDSDFDGNTAWDPFYLAYSSMGGAVDNHGATTTIHGGSFTGNQAARDDPNDVVRGRGGAVNLAGGTLTIDGAEFTGNETWGPGAAVYGSDYEGGTLNVSNSRFSGNTNHDAQYGDASNAVGSLAVGEMQLPGTTPPALTVTGSTFTGQASTDDVALSSTGSATINSSSFTGFKAAGAVNVKKTATITDSEFSDNANPGGPGGAVRMRDGTVTGSTFTGNQAVRGGAVAAIANPSTSASLTTVSGSRFIDNVASGQGSGSTPGGGGGVATTGSLDVVDSTFSGNSGQGNTTYAEQGGGGGAILSDGTSSDPLKLDIESSTFNGNTGILGVGGSGYGGAIYAGETATTITNSTMVGNEADHGGPVYSWNTFGSEGSVSIQASTIVGNTATQGYQLEWGSLPSQESTPISVGASIFAENDGPVHADAVFVAPFFTSEGYNLFDDDGGGGLAGTDLTNTDPKLDPDLLADNGGPTRTIALAADSPAIDAIPTASGKCQATDQRGRPRPAKPAETACDIGAYESDWVDTSTTLESSANPSVFGQQATFTAKVTAEDDRVPGGKVQFSLDGSAVGDPVALDDEGEATFARSDLAVGDHTVSASYLGANDFFTSDSSSLGQEVDKAETNVALDSSANPSVAGDAATYTATVTPVAPGAGDPGGTVSFTDGDAAIAGCGDVQIEGGKAECPVTYPEAGNHAVHASYGGDASFLGDEASLAQTVEVAPPNPVATRTTLASSRSNAVRGKKVKFIATVVPEGGGAASGTVTFEDRGRRLGEATLHANEGKSTATFSTASLAPGKHLVKAVFAGGENMNGSSSAGLKQVIGYRVRLLKKPLRARAGGKLKVILILRALKNGKVKNFSRRAIPVTALCVVRKGAKNCRHPVFRVKRRFKFLRKGHGLQARYRLKLKTRRSMRAGRYVLMVRARGETKATFHTDVKFRIIRN